MPAIAEPVAPSPAPAASPEPAPSTPPPQSAAESFDAAFPDDGLDSPEPAKPAGAEPAAAPEKPKETEGKLDKPVPAPEDKKPETPESPTGEYEPPKVGKPSELRSWASRMGARARKAEGEISELRQKLEQLESRPTSPDKTAALSQQLAAAQKEAQNYREQLRAVSYQRDPEFQEKYTAPRVAAVKEAYREIGELTVSVPDPDGVSDPSERPATAKDFDEVYFAPTTTAAINLAKQKFGDAWTIPFEHRKTIRRLMQAENAASEEWAKTAEQRENARQAETTQRSVAMEQMFKTARDAYAKKNPQMFAERTGDPIDAELMTKATQFADAVFGGNEGLTPQQIVMRDARAYSWLRTYPRIARDLKSARMEIDELKKTIDTMKGSSPGKASATPAETKSTENEGWEQSFERMVK